MAFGGRREVRKRKAAGRTSKAAFAAATKEYVVGSVVSKRKLIFSFAKLELSVTM